MQVFWVSGPVGSIRSINLSLKSVVLGLAVLAVSLLATGSILQFLGFRLALEYDPQIARRLGNLHTALELDNLNAVYHARLGELEAEHQRLARQVTQLQEAKEQLAGLFPPAVAKRLPQARAHGGPLVPLPPAEPAGSVLSRVEHMLRHQRSEASALAQQAQAWRAGLVWLEQLPLGLPVQASQLAVSSGYGPRMDPFTHKSAIHTGLDFVLPVGSPILAAGAGVVREAGWDPLYGHNLTLRHADGYSSRYGHASELRVRAGESVQRGQVIALAGNSGRSTGPHLHFEVLRHGEYLNPQQHLLALSAPR